MGDPGLKRAGSCPREPCRPRHCFCRKKPRPLLRRPEDQCRSLLFAALQRRLPFLGPWCPRAMGMMLVANDDLGDLDNMLVSRFSRGCDRRNYSEEACRVIRCVGCCASPGTTPRHGTRRSTSPSQEAPSPPSTRRQSPTPFSRQQLRTYSSGGRPAFLTHIWQRILRSMVCIIVGVGLCVVVGGPTPCRRPWSAPSRRPIRCRERSAGTAIHRGPPCPWNGYSAADRGFERIRFLHPCCPVFSGSHHRGWRVPRRPR